MTLLHSLILGLIEGFSEFLPISSTAHLILAADLMHLAQSAFLKSFEIVIQGGAIVAVLVVFWKKFLDPEILKRLVAAFIPTAIVGFVLYKIIKTVLIGNTTVVLWSLAIGGILIILFEKLVVPRLAGEPKELSEMSYRTAVLIGLAQSLAVIPGVSRSAATIIGGLWAGMSRAAIIEFSFLLAVPTILAASGYDLLKNADGFSGGQTGLLVVGFLAAFVTALLGIKFLLSYIRNRSFVEFGVYRIVIVLLFLVYMAF